MLLKLLSQPSAIMKAFMSNNAATPDLALRSGVYYIKECVGYMSSGERTKTYLFLFFAMVSVDAPNNLNDCGIATDTRCRWGVCRFIIQNSEFRINHHLIHPAMVVLHTLEAPFAE